MNNEQYRRANRVVFPVVMIVTISIILMLATYYMTGRGDWTTHVEMGSAILATIVSSIVFILRKDTKFCSTTLLVSASFTYFMLMAFGDSIYTYVYAFPILFSSMALLNMRYVIGGNSVILISCVIHAIRIFNSPAYGKLMAGDAIRVMMLTIVLTIFASIAVTKLLLKFNREKAESIEQAAQV
ncbi:MAG TPA: hypothetical protein VHQ24_09255, partial [Lachnospiraceae bacterium]|nr:hypothetical protein [Lachnospiraceae bacterium]